MKIKIDIDEKYPETSITIHAKEWSEDLETVVNNLQEKNSRKLIGVMEEHSLLLSPVDIDYIYAEHRKVFAVNRDCTVELKMKLYEVESMLEKYKFTRFSKSVIGNLDNIHRFELSFNGNLCVYFKSGLKEYVTRKYVPIIKEKIIMGGHSL